MKDQDQNGLGVPDAEPSVGLSAASPQPSASGLSASIPHAHHHAPGPWQTEPEFPLEIHKGTLIATVVDIANVPLIRTAPELLEALQKLHTQLSQMVFYDHFPDLCMEVDSAIAKATQP